MTARRIEAEWGLRGKGPAVDLLARIGGRLAAAIGLSQPWTYVVIKDRSPTAISIGDGRLYVSEGLMLSCETEAELAAVIAHEMGHEVRGHFCDPPLSRRGSGDLRIGSVVQYVDHDREKEADEESIDLLVAAGYDPGAALRVAERLARQDDATTRRLYDGERLHAIARFVARAPAGGVDDTSEFRRLRRRALGKTEH